MKGHVATPLALADRMVESLFANRPPQDGDRILYPGVGSNAPFVKAVEEYCLDNDLSTPDGMAIELDPERIEDALHVFDDSHANLQEGDFLAESIPAELGNFEYIIGNPPYVPVSQLSEQEKEQYGELFDTAWRRYDLYILFFERGLELLAENGRLVYVTPEKFEYISSADKLREKLATHNVQKIDHLEQDWFSDLKTYPAVTIVDNSSPGETTVVTRDGDQRSISLPTDGRSWAARIRGEVDLETGTTLGDISIRISAGLATGRDSLFVIDRDEAPDKLIEEGWTYPTVSGSQLRTFDGPYTNDVILCPYDERGNLVPESELGTYGDWAALHRTELEDRSCVEKRNRAWYAWHNAPPMEEILQPKIVCKDVTKTPEFWAEPEGTVIPRHSVYYIVPKEHVDMAELLSYLNSAKVQEWIEANAQKAHTDHYRIQSEVIEDLPVPAELAETVQSSLV